MRVSPNVESQAEWVSRDLEHLRYEYDLKPEDVVIDIGSYFGEWSVEIYKRYKCRMIGIEPTPYNKFQYFEVFINAAAADHEGKIRFGGRAYYTSAFEDPDHEYRCFDINPMLRDYPEIALMKMNIEGAEYSLLRHIIGAGLHKRIRNLQVQFHEIEGQPYEQWYLGIADRLSDSHTLQWQWPYCWENWSAMTE